jgi:hypothetical protein
VPLRLVIRTKQSNSRKLVSMKTMKAGFWIETIALVSAIACSQALFIAILSAAAGAAAGGLESGQPRPTSAIESQTYEGMITDTQCGARHSAAIGRAAADCTRVCVHGGHQFALVDGDRIYLLEGEPAALQLVAGQRARIVGTLNGNKISVASVAAII